jgi:hypothetical protein
MARRESTHERLTDNEEQLLHDAVLRVLNQALPTAKPPTVNLLPHPGPPDSHDTTRLQLQRLRREFPKLRIYVGRWGVPEDVAKAEPLLQAGAKAVFTKLTAAAATAPILLREAAAIDPPAPEIESFGLMIPDPNDPIPAHKNTLGVFTL